MAFKQGEVLKIAGKSWCKRNQWWYNHVPESVVEICANHHETGTRRNKTYWRKFKIYIYIFIFPMEIKSIRHHTNFLQEIQHMTSS